MKKSLLKTTILVALLAIVLLASSVNAATVAPKTAEVKAGETVTLTVSPKVSGDGVQFTLDYNRSEFKITGAEAKVEGSKTEKLSVDYDNGTGIVMAYSTSGKVTDKVTVTLEALKDVENATITVKDFVSGDEEVATVGSTAVKVNPATTVKPSTKPSTKPTTPISTGNKPVTQQPQTGAQVFVAAIALVVLAAGAIVLVKKTK